MVDPNPRRRHRRFNSELLERLMMLDQGSGEDILLSVAEQWGPCDLTTLSRRSNLAQSEVLERVDRLAASEAVVVLGELGSDNDAAVYSTQGWNILKSKVFVALQTYHNQYPLRRGAPVQEVRSRLGLSQPVFARALARLTSEGYIIETGQSLKLPGHQIALTPQMQQQVEGFLAALELDPYSPAIEQPLDPELLGALIDDGKVVKVNESVVFAASAYQDMTGKITAYLQDKGSITVAEARTMFNSSRKYMLPLLEYLDQQRITRRVGDERVLR